MQTLTRILRSFYGIAVVALLCYALLYLLLKLSGYEVEKGSLACLTLAVGFSTSRPGSNTARVLWFLYDGITAFFMMLAFHMVNPLLGIFEAVTMRVFGYLNEFRWSWGSTIALIVSTYAWFFVFGFSAPLYVLLLVGSAIVLGGVLSIRFHDTIEDGGNEVQA
ncbi:MAG: hypothetical protein KatS3mg007_1818 [Thermoanaerobaculum sp.]|nr:MAG: hypothetical protein KatS3mg007_1818 [Thermoanaerobaculum sp.]